MQESPFFNKKGIVSRNAMLQEEFEKTMVLRGEKEMEFIGEVGGESQDLT